MTAAHGGHDPVPVDLIRGALELAIEVARLDAASLPPVAPPRAIAKVLGFTRLPDTALATVRRSLEDDEEFRAHVAEAAGTVVLDHPSELFLTRPPGWDDELAALAAEDLARVCAENEEREEHSARRRLARAEAVTKKAVEDARSSDLEARRTTEALGAEQARHRAVEAEARRRIDALDREAKAAGRRADEAVGQAAVLRARITELEARPAGGHDEPAPAPVDTDVLRSVLDALEKAHAMLAEAIPPAEGRAGPTATRAAELEGGRAVVGRTTTAPSAVRSAEQARRRQAGRRQPAPLPPGVVDTSRAAAEHLVRVPGALLLVDGYNVAKHSWPGIDEPGELRRRLLAALEELALRAGTSVEVIWDSTEAVGPTARSRGRKLVAERFAPPGADVVADDVILEMVAELPVTRTLVVASSDRRVRDGAQRLGANVLSKEQLATVLGRRPG